MSLDSDDPQDIFTDLYKAEIKPPQWVIENVLPVGFTFIGGPGKSLKSTVTLAMANLVAGYKCAALPPFMSNVVRTGKVLMFSFEAEAGELRHISEEGMKVVAGENMDSGIMVADDPWLFRLDDPDGASKLLYWLETLNPRMVILDPLRRLHALNENDSGDMSRMMRPLVKWAKDREAAVIAVHHTRKKGGQEKAQDPYYDALDMRGTSDLLAMADAVMMISPIPKREDSRHINAIFKRGQPWERDVVLGVYGNVASQGELTDLEKLVLEYAQMGLPDSPCPSLKVLAYRIKADPDAVNKAVGVLKAQMMWPSAIKW